MKKEQISGTIELVQKGTEDSGERMELVHKFRYGTLEMMKTYAVITIDGGENIDFPEVEEIGTVLKENYVDQKILLIANRINHYSVNPMAINKLFSMDILLGGAILGHSEVTKVNAEVEKSIVRSAPIRYFESMKEVMVWNRELHQER